MDDRDQLLFSIAYALKMKARMPVRNKNAPPLEVRDYTSAATAILEHLELAGYRISNVNSTETNPGAMASLPDKA